MLSLKDLKPTRKASPLDLLQAHLLYNKAYYVIYKLHDSLLGRTLTVMESPIEFLPVTDQSEPAR